MLKKNNRVIAIRILCMLIGVLIICSISIFIWLDKCYVDLLEAIRNNDNVKVERLLDMPHRNLDTASGRFPWRWVPGFDEDNTPLELACRNSNLGIAKMLINKGADASYVHVGDFSPMYRTLASTDSTDYDLIKLLVENGADPRGNINDRVSSLISCSNMGCKTNGKYDIDKAKMILKIYKYLQARIPEYYHLEDWTDATPLHRAVSSQNIELIKYLLNEGKYDINKQDSLGETPAFLLADQYNLETEKTWRKEVLDLLIEEHFDPTIKNSDGKTVYDKCIDIGDYYLAEYLAEYMNEYE